MIMLDEAIEKLQKLRKEVGKNIPITVVNMGYECPFIADKISLTSPMIDEEKLYGVKIYPQKCFKKWDKVIVIE